MPAVINRLMVLPCSSWCKLMTRASSFGSSQLMFTYTLDCSIPFDEVGEVTLRRRLGEGATLKHVTVKSERGMPFSPTQTRTRHTDSFNIRECKERSLASPCTGAMADHTNGGISKLLFGIDCCKCRFIQKAMLPRPHTKTSSTPGASQLD
jgi:hypothetical protein